MKESTGLNWSDLFLSHTEHAWDSLYRFALSLARDEVEAEDLVQQTLLKALHNLPQFFKTNYDCQTPEAVVALTETAERAALNAHLLNWMMKIVKNTFLDARGRASERSPHVPLDEWHESETGSTHSFDGFFNETGENSSGTPSLAQREADFFAAALDDDWAERLGTLNPRQKSVLYLFAEEYSYKEIAQLLDIPIGTVMSSLSRAIGKLKKTTF